MTAASCASEPPTVPYTSGSDYNSELPYITGNIVEFDCAFSDETIMVTCGCHGDWNAPQRTCPADPSIDHCKLSSKDLTKSGMTHNGDPFHQYYNVDYVDDDGNYLDDYIYHTDMYFYAVSTCPKGQVD